jgi:hypothetical protein
MFTDALGWTLIWMGSGLVAIIVGLAVIVALALSLRQHGRWR